MSLMPQAAAPAPPTIVFFAIPTPPPAIPFIAPAPPPNAPPELPKPVRDVLKAAVASGDKASVEAVVRFTKAANPRTADKIEAIHQAFLADLAAKAAKAERDRRARLAAAGPLQYWKGTAELGGSRTTGNSDSLELTGALAIERDGIDWTHKLNAQADFQRFEGVTSADRVTGSYQADRKLDARFYAYGLAQYERDPILGYDDRETGGAGIGYKLVGSKAVKLSLEGGPAIRHTELVSGEDHVGFAGRASLNFAWTLSPTVSLSQDAAFFLERGGETNASATTAIESTLFGPLKMKLSYNILYETEAPIYREPLDTISRASLVYTFKGL